MYRLLIVDDEHIIRQGLSMLPWKENDIEVVGVMKNGIEALEWIDSNELDILMTDIRMPGMTGIELAKAAMSNYPNLKVILLSGYGEFEYAQEAVKFGAFDYILKPSSTAEILGVVKRACEKCSEDQEQKEKLEKLRETVEDYSKIDKPLVVDKEDSEDKIDRIIRFIYDHYAEQLTLSVLAEEFHFTTVYLSHYIKKETGFTFLEILTSVRMYYAAKYLKETKLKNGEICQRIGIPDERYFGQIFKKKYNMTPYEYRKVGEIVTNPFQRFIENEE